jgi:hypothetical protein
MTASLPPPRILVALAITVVAVAVLAVNALVGSAGDEVTEQEPVATSTTTVPVETTAAEVVETSVVVAPDWYPKGTSRYSDRQPAVTITTLATTTTRSGG